MHKAGICCKMEQIEQLKLNISNRANKRLPFKYMKLHKLVCNKITQKTVKCKIIKRTKERIDSQKRVNRPPK